MNKLSELAKQWDHLNSQLARVQADISKEMSKHSFPQPEVKRPGRKKSTSKTSPAANGEEKPKRNSMKKVVQELLVSKANGAELKELVADVTQLIADGKYVSKAKKLTPVVQQALHQLKAERAIVREKVERPDESGKEKKVSLYKLAAA